MKTFITTLVLAGAVGTSASAQDWAGFYGGVSLGSHSGDKCYDGGGGESGECPQYFIEGDDISLLAGYNFTNGPWVYGAELSASVDGVAQEDVDTEYLMSNFIDLKLRGGYVVSDILLFGSLGYSIADADENGTPVDASGALFSIGADYFVTDRFFIGAEYMTRFMEADAGTLNFTFEEEIKTLSIRAGYKF